ncbi:MAG TPA: hypothetical protein VEY09_02680 [Pyrinomonadaceae bacterium]|nr:hypothetical protein [Pyrinomonadaceae bacterium]
MTTQAHEEFGGDAEVGELVRGFESGELPPAEFGHRGHLTVALWYALRHGAADAARVMREALGAYLDRHGLGPEVYHETLTIFWMRRVCAFCGAAGGDGVAPASRPLYALANELAREFVDSRLVYAYYSEALIKSDAARREWVAPDLRPLDF